MSAGGALVAFAFLAPYLVMVLNSLRTSTDVKTTPTTIFPREWQWSTYAQVLGDERFAREIEAVVGRRAVPGKSGRPRKCAEPVSGALLDG